MNHQQDTISAYWILTLDMKPTTTTTTAIHKTWWKTKIKKTTIPLLETWSRQALPPDDSKSSDGIIHSIHKTLVSTHR